MRVLVTWGGKRGSTAEIARMIAEEMREQGVEVDLLPPERAARAARFDAVVVGGAIYGNRWHGAARRFVRRRERDLRRVPVWFFSSGPLDDSADRKVIPPTRQVETLMERVGAQGHVTFGGKLAPDADSMLAKQYAGDFRNPERIREWAAHVARALPAAKPGAVVAQPARSLARLAFHGIAGWVLGAAVTAILVATTSPGVALVLRAILVPSIFAAVAVHYFRPRGAREPLFTALAFAAIVAVFELSLAAGGLWLGIVALWLPLVLIFLVTLATGELMSTLPWSAPEEPPRPARPESATAR